MACIIAIFCVKIYLMFGNKPQKIEAPTQAYLPIAAIKDGVVVMKDHSLRAVVIVSSMNFALKSEEEKDAIVVSYQDFLNSLEFPVQIVASSRKIDLSGYLNEINGYSKNESNPKIKYHIDEYYSFIKELLESSNIMEKRFFVVVPFYPVGDAAATAMPNPLKKQTPETTAGRFDDHKKNLMVRSEEIVAGVSSVGLRCVVLGTEDLLELYYGFYNPDTARFQKLKGIQEVDLPVVTSSAEGPKEIDV